MQEKNIARRLEAEIAAGFTGREEEARVLVLALLTRQHAVLIGEPGVAKTAMIRRLSQLVNARFFHYTLSKYTVPDELIGAIDPIAYKQGRFVRNTKGKLPEAEIAFIDEVFKGSSETLNTLLTIMNERIFIDADGTIYQCPLWSLYGASNEIPSDSELAAFFDRFLIRHFVKRIDASALENAIIYQIQLMNNNNVKPIASLQDIKNIYDAVTDYMTQNANAIAKVTSQLVIVMRLNNIFISDRTAISPQHLPRLIATYAYVYDIDLRKAAIAVSKYILPSEEALENYKKALYELIPPELRAAQEKLERANEYASMGRLDDAKREAMEAMQLAKNLMDKPKLLELYREEVTEILERGRKMATEIAQAIEKFKKFKRGEK